MDLSKLSLEEIKKTIFECGVVGAGGAGFPTHAKLSSGIDTVILNCSECEPLFRVDRQLLIHYTREILDTLSVLTGALGAKRGVVAVKSVYKKTAAAVEGEIGRYRNLELKLLPDIYPVGDEVVLVYEVTGRIVPEGAVPLSAGAVVLNVETVLNIYNALFLNKPVTHKYVTITGEVARPVTVKAPLGITIGELIKYAGGAQIEDYAILKGGPMTGKLSNERSAVTKTTKCIVVLPKNHQVVGKREVKTSISIKRAMSVCSQCQMCTDLCPRNLLGHSIKPHRIMNALANNVTSDIKAYAMAMLCCECGLCEMFSCHQSLLPRRIIGELKGKLRSRGFKNPYNSAPESANCLRDERLVPMERLISRIGVQKYNADAPLVDVAISAGRADIGFSQHIGVPAVPLVKAGDMVKRGQLIGDIPENKLGSKIHASIDGFVTYIDEYSITIQARGDI